MITPSLSERGLASGAHIRCTGIMKRIGMLVVVTTLAVAGCGTGAKVQPPASPPSTSTTGSSSAPVTSSGSPNPSGSAGPDVIEFSVDGAGPYQLDMTLTALQAKPGLDGVGPAQGCPGNMTARGKGTWKDVQFSFHSDGVMYLAVNKSANIPTPSGAWLGSTVAELKKIYAGVTGEDLNRGAGKSNGFLVSTLSGRGVLFELDPGQRVISMTAGDVSYLRSNFMGATAFC
jgi:hypothetical protein